MTLKFKILGKPFKDNALFLSINRGQNVENFLFDCGENTVSTLSIHQQRTISHILISHFHMDHISGFDSFFRNNYNRPHSPIHLWGPKKTINIMYHRFNSFIWNLVDKQPGKWIVSDIDQTGLKSATFLTKKQFALPENKVLKKIKNSIFKHKDYTISSIVLNHNTPSIGYKIEESTKINIDPENLKKLALKPGPWLNKIKDFSNSDKKIVIDDKVFEVDKLREDILVETKGEKIAYLTDFIIDSNKADELIEFIKGVDYLICETQYMEQDRELARKNFHMVTTDVAKLALNGGVKKLIIFHISPRYGGNNLQSILDETRKIFPETYLPNSWRNG